MCTGHAASDQNAHRHGQPPAEIDRQVFAVRFLTQHDLHDHGHAERDQDQGAEESLRIRAPCRVACAASAYA